MAVACRVWSVIQDPDKGIRRMSIPGE